ncbi:hypothetical protein M7I_3117 [Glarea lozoyensis 74030]|uniref:Uncharacterized protein n=1 Tax=Glarea lozoyensis (strain ATCC 74030 / MF5533) TaxID=1104152 RepID=H0EKL8_GLAL7|nr:hypothetical protein M7I_3117 [Glarea lozoyensis 74030]
MPFAAGKQDPDLMVRVRDVGFVGKEIAAALEEFVETAAGPAFAREGFEDVDFGADEPR